VLSGKYRPARLAPGGSRATDTASVEPPRRRGIAAGKAGPQAEYHDDVK